MPTNLYWWSKKDFFENFFENFWMKCQKKPWQNFSSKVPFGSISYIPKFWLPLGISNFVVKCKSFFYKLFHKGLYVFLAILWISSTTMFILIFFFQIIIIKNYNLANFFGNVFDYLFEKFYGNSFANFFGNFLDHFLSFPTEIPSKMLILQFHFQISSSILMRIVIHFAHMWRIPSKTPIENFWISIEIVRPISKEMAERVHNEIAEGIPNAYAEAVVVGTAKIIVWEISNRRLEEIPEALLQWIPRKFAKNIKRNYE